MNTKPSLLDKDFNSMPQGTPFVVIDLGSNSFHLQLARKNNDELRLIETLGEKVQLAAGFDDEGFLTKEAQVRGLECLSRFEPFLRGVDEKNIRITGTNALREARNGKEFIQHAADVLNAPVEIISGREEARLIYLGMAHTNPPTDKKRLIIDIGGGSTEFALGQGMQTILLESLQMGCVSYKTRFMTNDYEISPDEYMAAKFAAITEINRIKEEYQIEGWDEVWGASGTIKAIKIALDKESITAKDLKHLEQGLLKRKSTQYFLDMGMRADRARVISAGLAILQAIFEVFQIDEMSFTTGALREGLLYEMVDFSNFDVCSRTIESLQKNYAVDKYQSQQIALTAEKIYSQIRTDWKLTDTVINHIQFAIALHEVGLTVSHHNYHRHGAYLIRFGDLAGFSRQQQDLIAFLIRAQRRKFPLVELAKLFPKNRDAYTKASIVLRLAILMNKSRQRNLVKELDFKIEVENSAMQIDFGKEFLQNNPLIASNLPIEAEYLKDIDFKLTWS